jgi:predicted MPP superfamily phosphohydrolase
MWLASHSGPFQLNTLRVSGVSDKPLRILHISDLHFAPGQTKKSDFLSSLADLNPDLVVNTGDNLGHKNAINPALQALEPLAKFPGVFVNGSNDYRSPKLKNPLRYFYGPSKVREERDIDTERFTSELENFGWLNLNNQSGQLKLSDLQIGFLGLDDPHENLDDLASIPSQRESVGGSDLVLGIAHAPYLRVLESFTNAGAAMVFAGHTHGGQLCLPGQRALVSNCDLPTEYATGLSGWSFGEKESILHVSAGLGCSIYAPLRVFCPPQATLIELN